MRSRRELHQSRHQYAVSSPQLRIVSLQAVNFSVSRGRGEGTPIKAATETAFTDFSTLGHREKIRSPKKDRMERGMRASRCELADSSPIITAPYPFSKNEKAGSIWQLITLGKMQEIHNMPCLALGDARKKWVDVLISIRDLLGTIANIFPCNVSSRVFPAFRNYSLLNDKCPNDGSVSRTVLLPIP